MFLQNTDLNIVPGGIIPVMHVSQYDVGRELKFVLYDGYDTADIATGTTVSIEGTKPDGHGFQYSGVLDQNAHTATFVTTEQMTVLAGAIECKLTLYLNSQRIGTALFILDVEKAGINDSTIISDTELPLIIAQATEQMERADAAADAAALSETNAATSETNAATSETNAANSEIICGSFMRMAGVSAASAEQSAIISGSFMRTAGNYADEAEASAASANVNALKSEGHALGTQNGTPVSSDSPYYHNNAKYWADEARQSSAGGVAASVIATAEPTNISSHAYAIGDQFVYNGILYTATSAISVGATITPGTNCSISDTITEQIGNAGHTILDEDGTTYPQRSKLQFEGCEVTDDSTNDITKIKAGDVRRSELVNTVGWTGKNLIPYPYYQRASLSFRGIDYTDDNGVITADGTCDSSNSSYFWLWITTSLPQGKYILSGCPAGGSETTYSLRIEHNTQPVASDTGNGAELIINKDNYKISIMVFVYQGTSISNLVFRPMLRHADIIDDTYEPYHESVEETLKDYEVLHSDNLLDYFDYISTDDAVITRDGDNITVTSSSGTYKGYEPLNPETGDGVFPAGSYQIYINIKSTNPRARLMTRNASTFYSMQTFDISSKGIKRFDITPSVPFYIVIYPKVNTSESGLSVTFNDLMLSKTPVESYKPYSIPLKDKVNALDTDKAETTDLAPVESGATASKAYTTGQYIERPDGLYKVTADIASGGSFTVGTNISKTTIAAELLAIIAQLNT